MSKTSLAQPSRSRYLAPRHYFSPFGNKLVEMGYIEPDKLEKALELRQPGRPLPKVLEELTGQKLTPDLQRQYKQHHLFELKILYGVDSLDPSIDPIAENQVADLIESLIPLKTCLRYKLLPLRMDDAQPPSVLVAMVDPDNLEALDELRLLLRTQEIELQRMVITEEDYEKILDKYRQEEEEREKERNRLEKEKRIEQLADVTGIFANLDSQFSEIGEEIEDDLAAVDQAKDKPIINFVNNMLAKALQEGASDIHIEPQENKLRIRYRKDGVLSEAFKPLPKKIAPAVIARIKIMSDLDIAEKRVPQDGKIQRKFEKRKIDFRVSTLPSHYGEKAVLRILDNESTQLGLDKLITDEDTLQVVRNLASRPYGIILVTGPTGSGKSTTLYSVLAERNDPGVNISTVEDPIEYSLGGITQVQVLREKGRDFASTLRSFLRQDPDIILVGETRDSETAKTAVEAALTGHLVLTTLHTNDAASAIPRLEKMGVETFMISGALLGILAQRLVRRVCSDCRIAYQPDKAELARFGLSATNEGSVTIYKANTLTPEEIEKAKEERTLCKKCNGIGYKGRVGVYEVMQVTERIQNLINESASTDQIKEAAVDEGMNTLLFYSLKLVQQGHTTLEEVERVTFTDSGLESELKARRKSSLTCQCCQAELKQEWLDCPYCLTARFAA